MVSSDCLASVDICAMRVSQLTAAGKPQAGSFGYYTTNVDSCKMGTTSDTIAKVLRRDGCGRIVTLVAAQPNVSGSAFSIDLLKWERDLISLMTGGTTFTTGGHTAGWRSSFLSDGVPLPVCIEVWSKAWDSSVQAITAQSTPLGSYHHWVMPFVYCDISSQFTLTTSDAVFTLTGSGAENPNITADGPFNDWPAYVAGKGGFTSALGEYDDKTIPTGACGLQTVPTTS